MYILTCVHACTIHGEAGEERKIEEREGRDRVKSERE